MTDQTKNTHTQMLFHCLIEELGTVFAFLFDHEFCCSAVIDMSSRMGLGALVYHGKALCVSPETGELGELVEFHAHVCDYLERVALEAIDDSDGAELYISGTAGEKVYNVINSAFPVIDPE
jgi:hypothetical protein